VNIAERSFDAEYVRYLVKGDAEIEQHFSAYFGALLQLKLQAKVRSPLMIEDIRQTIFIRVLKLLRKEGRLQHPERLSTLINSVSNNLLEETYRSVRVHGRAPENSLTVSDQGDLESSVMNKQSSQLVARLLADLPERDRNLLRLIVLEERGTAEVCKEMQVSKECLKVLLRRAKRRFRSALAKVPLNTPKGRMRPQGRPLAAGKEWY
jgi:RNA polymerase sigma factor (sigma-70 family)